MLYCSLESVPGCERQVEDQCDPVSVHEEQDSQNRLDGSFGNDVCVEAVAKIDGVDVITAG